MLVASELALVGSRYGNIVYSATKGGVTALVRSLAVHCAPRKIRVNTLCLGATLTSMLKEAWTRTADAVEAARKDAAAVVLGMVGTPEEIAVVALFLLSSASSFVDGHALVADGGATIW